MRLFGRLVKETFREMWNYPALAAAILMRPMGFRWNTATHRWERSGDV